jgi:hypothetical protein
VEPTEQRLEPSQKVKKILRSERSRGVASVPALGSAEPNEYFWPRIVFDPNKKYGLTPSNLESLNAKAIEPKSPQGNCHRDKPLCCFLFFFLHRGFLFVASIPYSYSPVCVHGGRMTFCPCCSLPRLFDLLDVGKEHKISMLQATFKVERN